MKNVSWKVIAAYCEWHFKSKKVVPTTDQLAKHYGVKKEEVQRALAGQECRAYLKAKGVPVPTGTFKTPDESLSLQQLSWCDMLLNQYDKRSIRQKAKEFGISVQTHQGWMREPGFRNFLINQGRDKFGDAEWEVRMSVVDEAKGGNVAAQKLYFEMTGAYTPKSQVTVGFDDSRTVDLLLEAIMKVCEPAQIQAISDEFEKILGDGFASRGDLIDVESYEVEVPEETNLPVLSLPSASPVGPLPRVPVLDL